MLEDDDVALLTQDVAPMNNSKQKRVRKEVLIFETHKEILFSVGTFLSRQV
jgi:hypothetical protein